MARADRLSLIRQIESARNSRVLVYITGDRRNLETKISEDTFPFIEKHLEGFVNPSKIDLFLYSTGGISMAGYTLVNMIREYTDSFGVLIPFKALSTATLIALGADDIIMSKMGQLSPIDPSFGHPLGPSIPVPGQPGASQPVPISVEDIFSYIDLAKDELQIRDVDSLERVLENLSNNIHPLLLGHGYRLREQIGFLADNLLKHHIDDEQKRISIIKIITRGRYSHDYRFGRREAKDIINLPIRDDNYVESLIVSLFEEYQQILELPTEYNPEVALGTEDQAVRTLDRAFIESDNLTHVYRTESVLRREIIQLPGTQIQAPTVLQRIRRQVWEEDNSI